MKIELIAPADGAQTDPLHQYRWPLAGALEELAGVEVPIAWEAARREVAVDRGLPRGVTFAWAPVPAPEAPLTYDLRLATDPASRAARCLADLPVPRAEVRHLLLDTRYFWQVTAKRDGIPVASSPTRSFVTHPAAPRWLHVPGITNVRDLGGWPVAGGGVIRQGLVYRTSEMNLHLQLTAEGRHILEEELQIRTDVDLREEGVACPALDPARVRWVNIPVRPYEEICEEHPLGKAAYRRVFALLADPAHYPLLFHCWGGADRGGTVAFLLGALLGMRLEALIHDYELTSLSVWGPRTADSPLFTALLAALRPFGDDPADIGQQVEHYLRAIGVTPAEIAAIRAHLVR